MEVLTIREVKRSAAAGVITAGVHVQVESAHLKPTKTGGEFLELKLCDAEDGFTMRVWSDAAGYAQARALAAPSFIALTAEWATGQYGLEPRQWKLRVLDDSERAGLLG